MNKRDLSISMAQANVIVAFVSIPVIILQLAVFILLHGAQNLGLRWNFVVFIVVLLLGVIVHELIHGVSWALFGSKSFSAVKLGFQWKTFTPYAHLREPVEISAYRIATFMPGFILGILAYILCLVWSSGDLFWFSLFHTSASAGDWLILWLIRNVRKGTLVEDHPTNAGCYVIEA